MTPRIYNPSTDEFVSDRSAIIDVIVEWALYAGGPPEDMTLRRIHAMRRAKDALFPDGLRLHEIQWLAVAFWRAYAIPRPTAQDTQS